MAASRAAYAAEKTLGHTGDPITAQDISKPPATTPHTSMCALTWQGKNHVAMRTVPQPTLLEPTDVILRVTGSTVCGSDLHLLHGVVIELSPGDILGHEFCGVVDAVGSAVKNVGAGDRVVASFQIACGECWYCERKLSSQCERTSGNRAQRTMYGGRTAGIFGYSHFTGGFAGGQAEYVRVPLGDVNLLKLPDDVPDEKGLYLSDVLCTAWHAVVDTGVTKDDVVAIWGAGPIGQMSADFAFHHGAARVILIDRNWRLAFCQSQQPRLETLNYAELPAGTSVTERLKEMTGGRGPDVGLECVAGEYAKGWVHAVEMAVGAETDSSEVLNEMITSVRNYGRVGVTGVYVGFTNHFNIGSLMERGIRLIGNGQAPVHKYWEELLEKVRSGEIDPLRMVTHRVRVEDLDKVYGQFEKKADGMQKVFAETRFSAPRAEGSPELTRY
ncbi:GroES-like protein [Eremomyces bilateralis CBS 781.70]|uniref:GroES-like protein n=1 Tax=Eremomyces bilateralis CBS 781.70 TaxID=1392243 RepID=A0A6G1G7B3_9PEZI|nr:GroES-like protein [Eremomyces bilateralis CBS 781.70]KAF1813967.1 GroES-like protein [Eremomyces bilateralis CBS 781.70]